MRYLLDTNVLIHAEDNDIRPTPKSRKAAAMLRLIGQANGNVLVSAATREDFLRAPEPRRTERLRQLERYHVLEPIYEVSDITARLNLTGPLSPQDRCDLEILCLLERGAANLLVTDDIRLRRRADRIGLGAATLGVDEVLDMCSSLFPEQIELLSVKSARPHQVSLSAPIFTGLFEDYPHTDPNGGFARWWKERVIPDNRDVLIMGDSENPKAICVLKIEELGSHGRRERALKLSPFKVHDSYSGSRLGELLLRASIDYARANNCTRVYLEILPKNQVLVDWLARFGFRHNGRRTPKGELSVVKSLVPCEPCGTVEPLYHHIKYGPGHLCPKDVFIVPIQRPFHARLFPEAPYRGQSPLPLYMEEQPCGNAIRKAYISGSGINKLVPGAGLVFLQTQQPFTSSVIAIGVVEEVRRPKTYEDLVSFVANRSIYTEDELRQWVDRPKPPLGILFRLDRILSSPLGRSTLIEHGVFSASPQSIQQIPEEASKWLVEAINQQS